MSNGKDNFDKNLNRILANRVKGAIIGLKLGGALVKRDSMMRTPVDEGNLKSSHYTAFQDNRGKATVEIGLTSNYAIYVHEIDGGFYMRNGKVVSYTHASGNGEAKFLENALTENVHKVRGLILKHSNA